MFPIIQHVSSPPKIAKVNQKAAEEKVAFLDSAKEGFYKYEAIDFGDKNVPHLNVSFDSSEDFEKNNAKKTPSMSPQQNNFSAGSSKAES